MKQEPNGLHEVAVATLEAEALRIVSESGRPDDFNAPTWVKRFIDTPHPALGGVRPREVMSTPEGVATIVNLIRSQQSGAFW